MPHAFHRLRRARLLQATRPFKARGHSLVRCERCFIAAELCVCHIIEPMESALDFVLLLHRDEILKPTNTGRLIADILPNNTHAFAWQRLELAPELEGLLADPKRCCALVFPDAQAQPVAQLQQQAQANQQTLTLILLDGTWKQARKMNNSSPDLAGLPRVICQPSTQGEYSLRKAAHAGCLSTVEAAIDILEELKERAAPRLQQYFRLFNQHYLASRGLRGDSA